MVNGMILHVIPDGVDHSVTVGALGMTEPST